MKNQTPWEAGIKAGVHEIIVAATQPSEASISVKAQSFESFAFGWIVANVVFIMVGLAIFLAIFHTHRKRVQKLELEEREKRQREINRLEEIERLQKTEITRLDSSSSSSSSSDSSPSSGGGDSGGGGASSDF